MTEIEKIHEELDQAQRWIELGIEIQAFYAELNLSEMYTIGTGMCYCGENVDTHDAWGNHAVREVRIDKSLERD